MRFHAHNFERGGGGSELEAALAGVKQVDVLKIDCEGCEYQLLLGSSPETLARVQRISAETHDLSKDQTAGTLESFLTRNGFWVRRRPNPVHDLSLIHISGPRD